MKLYAWRQSDRRKDLQNFTLGFFILGMNSTKLYARMVEGETCCTLYKVQVPKNLECFTRVYFVCIDFTTRCDSRPQLHIQILLPPANVTDVDVFLKINGSFVYYQTAHDAKHSGLWIPFKSWIAHTAKTQLSYTTSLSEHQFLRVTSTGVLSSNTTSTERIHRKICKCESFHTITLASCGQQCVPIFHHS